MSNVNSSTVFQSMTTTILQEVQKAVVGKDQVLSKVLTAFLAGGHVLMEDMPGVGKTTLATAFSHVLHLSSKRIQFTPDVLPSDLTGFSMYGKEQGRFVFQLGALFCNLFLADEINRTSSKTQSALLEAMEENHVTVEGKTYALPEPFLVIATQNPLGCVGTQALPESQMDRFLLRVHMGYPDIQDEVALLRDRAVSNPLTQIRPVLDAQQFLQMQQQCANVYVDDRIYYDAASLAKATREHPSIAMGISPRGTLSLIRASKALAMIRGRDYVLPDDIYHLCPDVFAHRLVPKNRGSAEELLAEILQQVPSPSVYKR